MEEIKCPYGPCGSDNENCLGCRFDPEQREMDVEIFWDMNCRVGCGDCKHCDPRADMDGVESQCRRLDHKHLQFAVPWFKSYDCGQQSGIRCSDFEPNEWQLWLYRHWKPEFNRCPDKKTIGLCLDGNQDVVYEVSYEDFYNDTFLDDEGNLKWVRKLYYVRSRSSAIGYKLIREYPDGRKETMI